MIHYDISPLDPEAHLFIVALHVTHPTTPVQTFSLPAWIKGSYLIRDFARHIKNVRAFVAGKPVAITKKDKTTWCANAKTKEELVLVYEVFAFDESVRGAYLDACRGFFNPAAILMQPTGIHEKIVLNIVRCDAEQPTMCDTWKIATSLKRARSTERFGWGLYEAKDYDELYDSPVELSNFEALTFKAHGTRHDIIINGEAANFDANQLMHDVKRICETAIEIFEPKEKISPVKEYLFLLNVTHRAWGGLEHRASAALACTATALPCLHAKERSKDYIELLNLFAHEYFHLWLVKRITPQEFVNPCLNQETYSTLLWLFEGFTTYYADRVLLRSGLIDKEQYADALTALFKAVLHTKAQTVQTLQEASFDAWIKFYKPSSDRANSYVSYYKEGALAALVLDLYIRQKTNGRKNLNSFLIALWKESKKPDYKGVSTKSVSDTLNAATGLSCTVLLKTLISSTKIPPYGKYLAPFGVKLLDLETNPLRRLLGIDGKMGLSGLIVNVVYENETGQWVGIATGDTLIAIDGVQLTAESIDGILARYAPGDEMVIHAFRDESLMVWTVLTGNKALPPAKVTFTKKTPLGQKWLRD